MSISKDYVYLRITPDECRIVRIPSKLMDLIKIKFSKAYLEEYKYEIPIPKLIVERTIEIGNIDFNQFSQSNEITSTIFSSFSSKIREIMNEDKESLVEDSKTICEKADRNNFNELMPLIIVLTEQARHSVETDVEIAKNYVWLKAGGEFEGWFAEGIAYCLVNIFIKEKSCKLLWWERETSMVDFDTTKEYCNNISKAFCEYSVTKNAQELGRSLGEEMGKIMNKFYDIWRVAKDKKIHFYYRK